MPTELIDGAIAFVAARDPDFLRQIRGADPADIDRLEQAAQRPLPRAYRQFLARMGRGTGWLKLGSASFDLDVLIRHREHRAVADPEGLCLIGKASADRDYDVYLQADGADTLRVVALPPFSSAGFAAAAAQHTRRIAGSLPQWIGDAALSTFCKHRMPHHRQVEDFEGAAQSRLDRLDALLAQWGVEPLWYSNDWMRSYEAPEFLVTAYEVPGSRRLIVDVRASSQADLERVYPAVRRIVKG